MVLTGKQLPLAAAEGENVARAGVFSATQAQVHSAQVQSALVVVLVAIMMAMATMKG